VKTSPTQVATYGENAIDEETEEQEKHKQMK
jgi:hypothetical protein